MSKKFLVTFVALMALLTLTATGQDAKAVIASASRAMGIEGLNSIHFYGVAQNGNLGQNNNSNQPWPMAGANDYVRAIDFTQPASRATWLNYAAPVTGGAATLTPGQQNITPQNNAWAQQLEIWITPWGFLKGAAANNATVRAQIVTETVPGSHVRFAVKSPGGQPYKVVGFINNQNLVEKVQTWLENPIFGDMFVETEYTQYREGANGLKFPATDRPETRRLADIHRVHPGGACESAESSTVADAAAGRTRWRRSTCGSAGGCRTDVGEAGRRRVSHQRRL